MSIMKDLAKIAAEKIIYTLETPRDVRKQERRTRRANREHWMTKYFGMTVPMSVQVWRTRSVKKNDAYHQDTPGN